MALGDGLENTVLALASFDGRIVAGTQKGFGADPAAPIVAAWNGTAWENIGTALEEGASNPQIRALTSGDGYLVAVGQFPFLGGAALFDGTKWTILTDMNFMGSSALLPPAVRRALPWRRLQPRGRQTGRRRRSPPPAWIVGGDQT